MKQKLYLQAIAVLMLASMLAVFIVLMPRTSEVYAADAVFSDEEVSEEPAALADRDGSGLELNGWPDSDDDGGEPLAQEGSNDDEITIKFHFVNKSATVARLKIINNMSGYTVQYSDSCAAGQSDTLKETMIPDDNFYCFIVQYWAFGWHDGVTYDNVSFDGSSSKYTLTAKGTALSMSLNWDPVPEFNMTGPDGTDDEEDYMTLKFKFVNQSATIARMYVCYYRGSSSGTRWWITDALAVGESETVEVKIKKDESRTGEYLDIGIQDWFFDWFYENIFSDVYFRYDKPVDEYTVTAYGTAGDITSKWEPEPEFSDDSLALPATIKASPKTVKKGKKTTVKVTSNSGAELLTKASNKKAKSALKKKYVKIREGKNAKITFTKKAPKGKYKFQVGSPANGNYKGTIKTITIKVK